MDYMMVKQRSFSSESKFQHYVIQELSKIGFFFTKEAGSIRGLPDVIGVANGYFVGLELKKNLAETKKNSGRIVLQKYRLNQMNKEKGFGRLVCPENWNDTYLLLCQHCRVNPIEDSYL